MLVLSNENIKGLKTARSNRHKAHKECSDILDVMLGHMLHVFYEGTLSTILAPLVIEANDNE